MGGRPRPEDHTPATSKFSSWLQDLIALDEVRKRTHQMVIDMDSNPLICTSVIGAMNEMYRIMRPLCDNLTKEIMAERFEQMRANAEEFVSEQRSTQKIDPYHIPESLPSELRFEISWMFDLIYDLRHDLKLGTKVSDKQLSTSEVLRRSAEL